MGYWENTVYINANSSEDVVNELSTMFADEGMVLVSSPKTRKRQSYEPMQYALALENNLWGVAVFPGVNNWVVIKTAPLELLGEKEPNNNRMRFVVLCERLKTSGFLYSVFDSGPEILVETDGTGAYNITGYSSPDPENYYGEQLDLNESNIEIQFKTLPFQKILDVYSYSDDRAEAFATTFAGENESYCDNLTCVETLVCHKPLKAKKGIALYYKWTEQNRIKIDSCSWSEWRKKSS